MKSDSREQAELKVVEYAKSVNWDFDRISSNIATSGDVITWDEWDDLEGHDSDNKVRNIFNKYKPKEEIIYGDTIEYYFDNNWYRGIYIAKGVNVRGHVVHKLPLADMSPVLAYDIRKPQSVLTRQQIADKFNIPVEQLVIKG